MDEKRIKGIKRQATILIILGIFCLSQTGIPFLILLISLIGLLFLKNWARILFTIAAPIMILLLVIHALTLDLSTNARAMEVFSHRNWDPNLFELIGRLFNTSFATYLSYCLYYFSNKRSRKVFTNEQNKSVIETPRIE